MRKPHIQAFQERILQVIFPGDPKHLAPYTIPNAEPIEVDGGVALGLTATLFRDVTYKGIRISGEDLIPKLDLQLYACWHTGDGQERSGAILLDEFLPQKRNRMVSKWLMGNDPGVLRMDFDHRFGQDGLISQFRWEHQEKWSTLKIAASKDMDELNSEGDPRILSPSSYFFRKKRRLMKCRVEHSEWKVHPVFDKEVRIDPSLFSLPLEGWGSKSPHSVHSIEGSNVSFSKPGPILL